MRFEPVGQELLASLVARRLPGFTNTVCQFEGLLRRVRCTLWVRQFVECRPRTAALGEVLGLRHVTPSVEISDAVGLLFDLTMSCNSLVVSRSGSKKPGGARGEVCGQTPRREPAPQAVNEDRLAPPSPRDGGVNGAVPTSSRASNGGPRAGLCSTSSLSAFVLTSDQRPSSARPGPSGSPERSLARWHRSIGARTSRSVLRSRPCPLA